MTKELFADGVPDEAGFFLGLARVPLHFHDAIAELIDNAIAEKSDGFNIQVDLSDSESSGMYDTTVMDDCLGISKKNLQNHVFKVGSLPLKGSSHLREHGFGLKNVLAKIEAVGGSWKILTQDKTAVKSRQYYLMEGPLQFKIPIQILPSKKWPDFGSIGEGTIVRFSTPFAYLKTVSRGKRGRPPGTIAKINEYLREHLGVFYRGYLEDRRLTGRIVTSINWKQTEGVEPIMPDYRTHRTVRKFVARTKKGPVHIVGEYGELEPNSVATNDRLYYYRVSSESQGVDFRIGNRVVATRLIPEIWSKERHPTLNRFCGEFIMNPVKGRIPRTLNNKTSIDFDDEIWRDIAQAISEKVDLPKWEGARTEAVLRDDLYRQLEAHTRPKDVVHTKYSCFSGAGVVIDIYRDESRRGGELVIYETKPGKASPLDVYQLRMYWDGIVEDGKRPTASILVCKEWTTGAETVMDYVNSLKDKKGEQYCLEFKKWDDFGIDTG